MPTKILMCYNDTPNVGLHKSVRITIPNEWLNLKVKVLLKYYVKLYNGIFANKLNIDNLHLATKPNENAALLGSVGSYNAPVIVADPNSIDTYEQIPLEELISIHILDHTKVYVRHGKGISVTSVKPTSPASALVLLERVSSYTSDNQLRIKSFDEQNIDNDGEDEEEDDIVKTNTKVNITKGLSTVPEEESQSINASLHDIASFAATSTTTTGRKPNTTSYVIDQRNDIEVSNQDTRLEYTSPSLSFTKPSPVERSTSMITQAPALTRTITNVSAAGSNVQASRSFASESTKTSNVPTSSTKLQPIVDVRSVTSNTSRVSKSLSPTSSQRSVHYFDKKNTVDTVKSTVVDTPTVPSMTSAAVVGLRDEEDAAIIRFRSILEWLGVHHTLYDGVVRALEVEISTLKNDDEKHELIKKKLGALLEASYLNASRKGTLSVTSGSIASRKKRSSSNNSTARSISNNSTNSKQNTTTLSSYAAE